MAVFERGATFTAFDLSDIFWSKSKVQHNMWTRSTLHHLGHHLMVANTRRRLMERSITLYREGKIHGGDCLKVFDVSETIQAFRYFSQASRIGKVTVSFQDLQSRIPVSGLQKYYGIYSLLIIGCSHQIQDYPQPRKGVRFGWLLGWTWTKLIKLDVRARCQEIRLSQSFRH